MVKIVTMPGCGFCNQAKAWMRRNGIDFEEVSFQSRPDLTSFPVLLTEDGRQLVGWDSTKWYRAIESSRVQQRVRLRDPQMHFASGQADSSLAAPPPASVAPVQPREPEVVGSNCGKRVTPTNVGTMLGVGALGTVFGSDKWVPILGVGGAVVYVLGAMRFGCQVRAAGTGMMLGAVGAAVKHCVMEDRRDAQMRAGASSGQLSHPPLADDVVSAEEANQRFGRPTR